MRSTKCLVVAAVLAAGIGSARADVYTYTSPVSGGWDDGGDSTIRLTPQVFNDSLGTLTGVSISVDGLASVTDYTAMSPGVPEQTALTAFFRVSALPDVYGLVLPAGQLDNGNFTGTGTYEQISAGGAVHAGLDVPQQYLAAYADPRNANGAGILGGDLLMEVRTYLTPNAVNPIGFAGQIGSFNGSLTETFTYTPSAADRPTPVPEPGSLALLGTAAAMLAGTTRLTKRRPRS